MIKSVLLFEKRQTDAILDNKYRRLASEEPTVPTAPPMRLPIPNPNPNHISGNGEVVMNLPEAGKLNTFQRF